jgi:superoxide dismutase, Fe-Mn family
VRFDQHRFLRRVLGEGRETSYYSPVKIDWTSLPGVISAEQQEAHWKLYLGYLDTLKNSDSKLSGLGMPGKPEASFRGLKEAEAYASGGAVLHALYFEGLTDDPGVVGPPNGVQKAIQAQWGSLESWWREMRAAALNARGWAILGVCEVDPTDFRIAMMDTHVDNALVGYVPLCVVDVYEHAYWADHYTDRAAYLDGLHKFLNWEAIQERYEGAK